MDMKSIVLYIFGVAGFIAFIKELQQQGVITPTEWWHDKDRLSDNCEGNQIGRERESFGCIEILV